MPAQPDFYYERNGIPGVCVFVDGGVHALEDAARRDERVRGELEERVYRVIAIDGYKPLELQVSHHPDVFGHLLRSS